MNNKRLFVAGLPFSTTDEELRNLFAEFGNVISARVIMDKFSGKSKGFGFVELETPEAAAAAMAKLNGSDFGGRKLVVNEAKPMEDRPKREGGYRGGGGGSRGGFGQKRSFGGGPRREGGRGNFGRGRDRSDRRGSDRY